MRPRLYRPTVDVVFTGDIELTFTTTTNAFESFYALGISPGQNVKIELSLAANRQGGDFATFTRHGMFSRNGGANVSERLGWHHLVTDKTRQGFDVGYQMTANFLILRAKSYTSGACNWRGTLRIRSADP